MRGAKWLSLGALVTGLGTAFACSSSTPTPPDDTVEAFCSDWANAYCQLSTECQFDATQCATYQTAQCNQFATAATQASGGTSYRQYSQPAGAACIQALKTTFGGNPTEVSASDYQALITKCNEAFPGNQSKSEPCNSDYDCQSGLACVTGFGATQSLCEDLTQKNLNDPCGDPGDECQGSTYCATSATGPQCTASPAIGAQCVSSTPDECGTTARCLNGACTALAGVGDACSTDSDCQLALFCDPNPSVTGAVTCASALTFAKGSDDCRGIGGEDQGGSSSSSSSSSSGSGSSSSSSSSSSSGSSSGALDSGTD
jgi:uncharacterized membrane protein YgcG